jgi:hypothetical protein
MANHSIENLLKGVCFRVATIQEARKKFSAQLAPEFNLFDYLRDDEMGVSKIIADLLDPKGNHGQGDAFLQVFANKLEHEWIVQTNDWQVVTEQQANGQRRIDIYMESPLGVIGIENKPWAADQNRQLHDYADYLDNKARGTRGRKWLLIYLGNSEPSEDSISKSKREALERSGNFASITFQQVVEWLNACAGLTKAIVVRIFIEEFSKFVRNNINGEPDMSEENEVIDEIRKSSENIASAIYVSNAMKGLKEQLLTIFHDDLKRGLEEKGFQLVWDSGMSRGWSSYVGFGVKRFSTQDKYLRFEFEGSGLGQLFWGIRRNDDSVVPVESTWLRINELMNTQFGGVKQSNWWPWYSIIPDHTFDDDEYKHWFKSKKPWVEMNSRELSKRFVNLAVKVDKIFSGEYQLLQPIANTGAESGST